MKKAALIVYLSVFLCGCQQKQKPIPPQALAPGEKTADHLIVISVPHAFHPYAELISKCDRLIHQDLDAMHENILDLRIRRSEKKACLDAMAYKEDTTQ